MGPMPLLGAHARDHAVTTGPYAYAALEEAEYAVLAELAHMEAGELVGAASTS